MSKVKRVYSEKMPEFAVKAKELSEEISSYLNINTVTNVRVLIRYDIENITKETYEKALVTVFQSHLLTMYMRKILPIMIMNMSLVLNFYRDSLTKEPIVPYSVSNC